MPGAVSAAPRRLVVEVMFAVSNLTDPLVDRDCSEPDVPAEADVRDASGANLGVDPVLRYAEVGSDLVGGQERAHGVTEPRAVVSAVCAHAPQRTATARAGPDLVPLQVTEFVVAV